jgi:hypothetical protein
MVRAVAWPIGLLPGILRNGVYRDTGLEIEVDGAGVGVEGKATP